MFLFQYVDATMHLATKDDAARICCVDYINFISRILFSVCRALPNKAEWFGASINAHYKGEKKHGSEGRVLPILLGHCLLILFTGAETEIHKIKDDSKIKTQTNLDRRGPRTILIVCGLPPSRSPFFLVTDYLYTAFTPRKKLFENLNKTMNYFSKFRPVNLYT